MCTVVFVPTPPVEEMGLKLYKLRNQQNANQWRKHQSLYHKKRGQCCWEKCPGIAKSIPEVVKRGWVSTSAMYCEECSARLGKTIYLCNSNMKEGGRSYCHTKYHNKYHWKKYLDAQMALKEMHATNNV